MAGGCGGRCLSFPPPCLRPSLPCLSDISVAPDALPQTPLPLAPPPLTPHPAPPAPPSHLHPSIWCVCIGFISGLIGQFGLDAVLKRIGRPSVVVLLLGSIVATACMGMLVTGSIKIARDVNAGKNLVYFNTDDFMCFTAVAAGNSTGNATLRM